ncbi:sulfotransferase family protein [Nocardioides anomalus]|uniref:Sulfotransferase family protein n=1 Tax=Nocardioides anomalus TaxID=2712223 RepID=A0A6G6WHU6_9ACTN|nr:sulfotransferase family 2 domain-containing protein [Nocardioides anomalus]QIG44814.1 sulfotransferase family protein [Nocardioides anomalus]
MIVSHPARVLFVHVQKTGGSSVQSVLLERLPGAEKLAGLPGAKHAHLTDALAHDPGLATYWTFGFVRNPWARLWSWWSMISRREDQRAGGNAWADRRIANNAFWRGTLELETFERFVLEGPDRFARLRTPQRDYLRAGEREADFTGRTESFGADFRTACEHLGIEAPPEEPRRNADPGAAQRPPYREQYTPAMRDRVAELFAADLDAYGYDF